jgi:hypothetical protein
LIDEKAAQPIIVLLFLVVHGGSKGVLKTNAVSYGIHGGSKGVLKTNAVSLGVPEKAPALLTVRSISPTNSNLLKLFLSSL